ncbi:thiamine pyrophosphate-binding protein [Nonomuraea sp. NPDC050202]|uniref:thiamine pyrophosphate-binding protein n=1 Tax=Nonomuraea sp. NPDC050202 TaxID=3155035 RepID=UPI0033D85B30
MSSLQTEIIFSLNGDRPDAALLTKAFRRPDGTPDALRCGEFLVAGRERAELLLRKVLGLRGVTAPQAQQAIARAAVDEVLGWRVRLTGAEAVAVLLAAEEVKTVFVYAGTSELSMCDAVERVHGVRLVNGRGDKESAFMAAGASLLEPNRGVAILHGARGLTNAAGAVADARRNEAGTLFIVGMPSTSSARFLPPHGEDDLMGGMGAFADWIWQAGAVPEDPGRRREAARRFVGQLRDGLDSSAQPPTRPAIFGVPQDVAEQRWIPVEDLMRAPAAERPLDLDQPAFDAAFRELRHADKPLFLIDDYALRHPGLRQALDDLSGMLGAPVLQLRYRRGPMMFERLQTSEVANFAGWLNQFSSVHTDLLEACDLLVTVEDRNLYERTAGRLPSCRKIAINTDPEKVLKNEYLDADDVLVIGEAPGVLSGLADRLRRAGRGRAERWWPREEVLSAARVTPEPAAAAVEEGRGAVAGALAGLLGGWDRPVLVDDSQMFGGLLSEHYDDLPPGLRVFGGHGGFVGGGLSYAVGLAIADPRAQVLCTLGDQGFTNSFQGLVAAVQERAPVLFVVCNNGRSVSLTKQALASFGEPPGGRGYLSNVAGFSYCRLAAAFGMPAERVPIPIGGAPDELRRAVAELPGVLARAAATDGPALVELVLPADPEVWRGIWITQGFEQRTAVPV